MRTARILLVLALLLGALILTGCNEQQANANHGVKWRSTQTGFFTPEIAYSQSAWPIEE